MLTLGYGEPGAKPIAERVGDLRLPDGRGPHPLAVVIHGGFWRAHYKRELMDGICEDLARRGWASWNIEYRRVGAGGGWPATFDDVAAAVDQVALIAEKHHLDATRIVTVGHSAGGHLALWAALRHNIAPGVPGASPLVRPALAIGQAAVADLRRAATEKVGGSAVSDLMGGGPDEVPERYAAGSPIELLPANTPTVLIHGTNDEVVPVSLSRGFVDEARRQGDDANLVVVQGGHFEHIDPCTEAWAAAVERIECLS
ncbi:MAG TPA: alpha/beta hydrolase [Acidimicrobiales bacterium]|nr:alpha/beta hydrolase [Acidimicrobiales bacterium]